MDNPPTSEVTTGVETVPKQIDVMENTSKQVREAKTVSKQIYIAEAHTKCVIILWRFFFFLNMIWENTGCFAERRLGLTNSSGCATSGSALVHEHQHLGRGA